MPGTGTSPSMRFSPQILQSQEGRWREVCAAPSPTCTVSPSWRRGGVRRGGGSEPRPCFYLVLSPEPWGETQGTPGAVPSGQSLRNGHTGEQIRCTEGGTQRECHPLPARSQQPWGARRKVTGVPCSQPGSSRGGPEPHPLGGSVPDSTNAEVLVMSPGVRGRVQEKGG